MVEAILQFSIVAVSWFFGLLLFPVLAGIGAIAIGRSQEKAMQYFSYALMFYIFISVIIVLKLNFA